MRPVRNAFLQTIAILAIGATVGFTANALRADGSIKPFFNYFDKSRGKLAPAVPSGGEISTQLPDSASDSIDAPGSRAAPPTETKSTGAAIPTKKLDHDFKVATFEDMVDAFNDPAYEHGLFVFVDARNDEAFGQGHIPGAIQADHYQLEKYIDAVRERAVAADKVFVYCNGGECEDSIFMCGDLLEYGIAKDVLYLYEGGWKEWVARGMPVEPARDQTER